MMLVPIMITKMLSENVDADDESMKSKREIPDSITVYLYADGVKIDSKKNL